MTRRHARLEELRRVHVAPVEPPRAFGLAPLLGIAVAFWTVMIAVAHLTN